jgi:restriction endonuclease S subunit
MTELLAKQEYRALLPSDWQLKSLDKVIDIRNGYAFKSVDFTNSGVLLVRQSNLTSNGISTKNAVYLPKYYFEKHIDHRVCKGDVVIGMSGSIGKLCVYDLDTAALQNQRIGLIKFPIPEYKEYITYYLRYIESELLALANGEAVKNISSRQIKSCKIPLPPANRAQRIASQIKSLLVELEAAAAKLVLAKASINHYRTTVLQKVLYGKQSNKHVKLGQVAQTIHGYNFPNNTSANDSSAIPFFKVADLARINMYECKHLGTAQNYISANTCKKHKLNPLNPGLIIFAKTGEAIKLNQRAILKQPALIDNNMMGVISSSQKLDNTYLYYLLLSTRLENLGRATTVPSVRKSDIANLSIPIPPISEQLRIVAEIECCFDSAGRLEKKVSDNMRQTDQLRQSIFNSAFTGKLIEN